MRDIPPKITDSALLIIRYPKYPPRVHPIIKITTNIRSTFFLPAYDITFYLKITIFINKL